MCATAIANLMQQSASEGNHRNMFSKDKVSLNLAPNMIFPPIFFFFYAFFIITFILNCIF